ncbi:MAG: hypothetical protein R3B93_08185 [Bacteroidia bacterium]
MAAAAGVSGGYSANLALGTVDPSCRTLTGSRSVSSRL